MAKKVVEICKKPGLVLMSKPSLQKQRHTLQNTECKTPNKDNRKKRLSDMGCVDITVFTFISFFCKQQNINSSFIWFSTWGHGCITNDNCHVTENNILHLRWLRLAHVLEYTSDFIFVFQFSFPDVKAIVRVIRLFLAHYMQCSYIVICILFAEPLLSYHFSDLLACGPWRVKEIPKTGSMDV